MNPLISIVVPVYNTEKYIAETIESVIAQTYDNWELLLIDDGSTDSSRKIIESFVEKDSRIKYHYKENGGQASARNLGVKKANGEYIAFLDSDDIWLPKKLEHQIEELIKYKPDFLYGLGYFYYPEKAKDEQLVEYDWITGERSGLEFFHQIYLGCIVNTNTVLLKRDIFERIGYFDENEIIRGTEDWDLWMRIALQIPKVYGSPKRNVYYRIHEEGIHLQHARMIRGKITVHKKYHKHPEIKRLKRLRGHRYNYRELLNILPNDRKELKQTFKELTRVDPIGFGTFLQRIMFPFLKQKSFLYFSNKFVYRIAYRLEHMTYKIFNS